MGVLENECKRTCEEMPQCLEYNPGTNGDYCFIHYDRDQKDTGLDATWEQQSHDGAGPVVSSDSSMGGMCYAQKSDGQIQHLYTAIGSGMCTNAAGERVTYTQKAGVPQNECKRTCEEMPQCLAFNPGTNGDYCFIHYDRDQNDIGLDAMWEQQSHVGAGPVVSSDP